MATLAEFRSSLDALAHAAPGAVLSDAATLELYGQDVFSVGARPLAVFRPRSTAELVAGVREAAREGLVLVPRGGGMSYTSGYLHAEAGAVVVDTAAMTRIVRVDETDARVRVEAGVTWAQLFAALSPRGLRTPMWGTLSGAKATIGGGCSQNGTFWGARNGSIAAQALSFGVIDANGDLIETNPGAIRPFGPDLTGLYGGDCGAFGIKAEITLPLVPIPGGVAYGSFSFDAPGPMAAAMSRIAREGLASECFGFDPFLAGQRARRDSLAADAKQLVGLMRAQGGFWRALKEGAKVAAAGRGFIAEAGFQIHLIAEGRMQAAADADMAAARAIVAEAGGREIEASNPKILRANPFPPVNSMLGPEGERWAPVHGIVRHSQAAHAVAAITALYEARAGAMQRLGVGAGYMFLAVPHSAILIEPVFYWPEPHQALHRASVEPAYLARLRSFPAVAGARELVDELRAEVIALFARLEATHFQIGRAYPLLPRLGVGARAMLRAVKDAADPAARMNPGVLGL
ncbi:MAG: FAD-binding oxidoreductase [Sphingomonadaceae bacterium]|nr:FAD-binding oxidoreductase [Sphingomonadaceae bacterium]